MISHFIKSLLLLCILLSLSYTSLFAANIEGLESTLEDYGLAYQKNSYIDNDIMIDLSPLEVLLKENFSDIDLQYEWEILGKETQRGPILNVKFESTGRKMIQLSMYTNEESENEETGKTDIIKTRVYQSDISILVYKKSVPLLVSDSIPEDTLKDFLKTAEEQGVLIKTLGQYSEKKLVGKEIIEKLGEYIVSFPENSDYLVVWGEKEFLFSTLSQLSLESNQKPLNFVLVSSYNTSILKNYIGNIIAGTNFIQKAFIIDESLNFQIIKNPERISDLELEVSQNSYSYTPISTDIKISPFLFASQFINQLSLRGINVSDLYLILLLPIFLTLIGVAKHMIGITAMGSLIPIFIAILFLKFGLIHTFTFLGFLFSINIAISLFLSKYTLLYTPKVSLITIVNILGFMLFFQAFQYTEFEALPFDGALYFVLFFIVSEKLITIITSKEFREYKKSITGTLIISLFCYILFYFDALRVFLFAYPEILLVLIPFNFFLGRFTGLRVTEYLRFREITKDMEE